MIRANDSIYRLRMTLEKLYYARLQRRTDEDGGRERRVEVGVPVVTVISLPRPSTTIFSATLMLLRSE